MTIPAETEFLSEGGKVDPALRPTRPLGPIARLVALAAVLILVAALWSLSSLLLLVYGSVLIAILLRAVSELLGRVSKLSSLWALALTVAMFIFLLVVMGALFGATVAQQFSGLVQRLPEALETIEAGLRQSSNCAKGSSNRPSNIGACSTASSPPNINPLTRSALR